MLNSRPFSVINSGISLTLTFLVKNICILIWLGMSSTISVCVCVVGRVCGVGNTVWYEYSYGLGSEEEMHRHVFTNPPKETGFPDVRGCTNISSIVNISCLL